MYKNGKLIPTLILQKEHMRFFKIALIINFCASSLQAMDIESHPSHSSHFILNQIEDAEHDSERLLSIPHRVSNSIELRTNALIQSHHSLVSSNALTPTAQQALEIEIENTIKQNKYILHKSKIASGALASLAILFSAGTYYVFNIADKDTLNKQSISPQEEIALQGLIYTITGGMLYGSWRIFKAATTYLPAYTKLLEKKTKIFSSNDRPSPQNTSNNSDIKDV